MVNRKGMLMDEFNLRLVGELDQQKTVDNLKQDLKDVEKKLDKLKVEAELADGCVKKLEGQLDSLNGKLSNVTISQSALNGLVNQINGFLGSINVSNININSKNISTQVNSVGKQIGSQLVSAINTSFLRNKSAFKFQTIFEQTSNAAITARNYFQQLLGSEKAILTLTEKFDNTNLNAFTVNVKRASGEVESLRYELQDTANGMKFVFKGGAINDAGAIRQIQKVEKTFSDYTARISKFKSTNQGILSGLTAPLEAFEKSLASLKSGGSTIGEVIKNFNTLESEAAKISVNLNNTTSSFNKIQNAINNIAKGEEIIKGLSAQFKGLKTQPQEVATEIRKVSSLLKSVKKIESTEGRGEKWSKKYAEYSSALSALQAKLNTLVKQDKFSVSEQILNTEDLDKQGKLYVLKLNNTIEKTLKEIEPKLRKAGYVEFEIKGTEKANGQIKSLVVNATDAYGVVKKLRFETAKLQKNGKAQTGLVQLDEVKYLGKLSKNVEKVRTRFNDLKNQWEAQGVLVGTFKEKVEELGRALDSVNSKKGLASIEDDLDTLYSEATKVEQIQQKLTNNVYLKQVSDVANKLAKYGSVSGKAFDDASASVGKLNSAYSKLLDTLNDPNVTNSERIQVEKDYQNALRQTQNLLSILTKDKENVLVASGDNQRIHLINKLNNYLIKNTAITKESKQQIEEWVKTLSNVDDMTVGDIRKIITEFETLDAKMRAIGKLGLSPIDKLKQAWEKFGGWSLATGSLMAVIGQLRRIPEEVYAIDTAMTELYKVTDETTKRYEEFLDIASQKAKNLGVTLSGVVEQTATWVKLGFSLEKATQLADVSSMYVTVGEVDSETAVSDLVTAMKAFNIEASDSIGIVNRLNKLANEFATDAASLGSGLKNSASALALSGDSIDQLLSMLTGVTEITQNASESGNMLKVLSMRIRGMKGELEALGEEYEDIESISKIQTQILNRTRGSVNIFD